MIEYLRQLKNTFPMFRSGCNNLGLNYIFICGIPGSGTSLLHDLIVQRYRDTIKIRHYSDSPFPVNSADSHASISQYLENLEIPVAFTSKQIRALYSHVYEKKMQEKRSVLAQATSANIVDRGGFPHLIRAQQIKSAFPECKFLVIFRNPVHSIEGLRRKWKLFGNANFNEVCDLWENLYSNFMLNSEEFSNDVFWVNYENLAKQVDREIGEVAAFCHLEERDTIKKLGYRKNEPGKGLRNVCDGAINVVYEETPMEFTLSERQVIFVNERLSPLYHELKKRGEKRGPAFLPELG